MFSSTWELVAPGLSTSGGAMSVTETGKKAPRPDPKCLNAWSQTVMFLAILTTATTHQARKQQKATFTFFRKECK